MSGPTLSDLNLAGLSIDDLVDLLRLLRPMGDQFDTASMGRPFVVPHAGGVSGIVEDTAIGEVFSSIGRWSVCQARRVLQRLKEIKPTTSDEADLRASVLIEHALIMGDWTASHALFQRLMGEAEVIRGRGK